LKSIKRRKPTSMEGEYQVGRRNQLIKSFTPKYRIFKKKPYGKNHLSLRAMSHWLEAKDELQPMNIH